jgi:glycosyltransferase involved in cell wall biosynthesis
MLQAGPDPAGESPAPLTDPPMGSGRATARRRLALVIANLGWGGAQKVMTVMANHWASAGWEVTLISIDARRVDCYFPPLPQVRLVYLGAAAHSGSIGKALFRNGRRVAALRKAIRTAQAEAVISFLSVTNVLTILATRGLGIPVIVSERGDPDRDSLPRAWRYLRKVAYPLADSLVAQTEGALARFGTAVRRRGTVIANPVSTFGQQADHGGWRVAGVGHLVGVKGFDLLVQVSAGAATAHADWQLAVWGEGPGRDDLLAMAERHGVAGRVELPGRSAVPAGWLASTTIFVLSSRHEGFPNALVEAMAAGIPVIATDCPVGGPRAMISSGLDGLLVPPDDVAAMAAALARLMGDPALRRRLGTAAVKSVERYAEPAIMAQWTGLVEQVIAARSAHGRH